jgi:1,4-dihydroxy-2-naphthoyl-CoA hydrolase
MQEGQDQGEIIKRLGEEAHKRSVHAVLDISIEKAGPEEVVLSMPVTWKAHQPAGILHGGVSAVLAESAASLGAALNAPGKWVAGIDLNISHMRAVSSGTVRAVARPLRVGTAVQVWDVDIFHQETGKQVAKARLTVLAREASRGTLASES